MLLLLILRKRKMKILLWFGLAVVLLFGMGWHSNRHHIGLSQYQSHHHKFTVQQHQQESGVYYHHYHTRIKAFSAASNHPTARKQQYDLASLHHVIEHVILQPHQQRAFLESVAPICGEAVVRRFDELQQYEDSHLQQRQQQQQLQQRQRHHDWAAQLWKYCQLYVHGGVVLDATAATSTLFLVPLDTILFMPGSSSNNSTNHRTRKNVAILQDATRFPNTMHPSLLFLTQPHSNISRGMLHILLNTTAAELQSKPLLLPQTLYRLIHQELELGDNPVVPGLYEDDNPEPKDPWYIMEQKCTVNPFRFAVSKRTTLTSTNNSWRHKDVNASSALYVDQQQQQHRSYPCAHDSSHCCHVYDNEMTAMVAMTRDALWLDRPVPSLDELPKPFLHRSSTGASSSPAAAASTTTSYQTQDLPYMVTLRMGKAFVPPRAVKTPPVNTKTNKTMTMIMTNATNAHEALSNMQCLPSKECVGCFRSTDIVTSCDTCHTKCACYCEKLCRMDLAPQRVQEIHMTLPHYQRDPKRLIPRVIHQTWFEPINTTKYVHTGRFVESFKQSGWEYRFYTDDMAASFLTTHFPPQVRQAYDDMLPGAFKADLFRYCVLLIYGGLYADVDIMLASNLDAAIDHDVGFLAPVDCLPGYKINRRMCLWNGFIAVAPGHPFIAKVVETVVNNIRNRFTLVDYDNMYCPNPELSIVHGHDDLFTSGPCVLGAVVNQVLGRPVFTQFDDGEVRPTADVNVTIPGKTVILWDSKDDLGAHRFTHWDKNMILAGTDFPDSNDRNNKKNLTHYSMLRRSGELYGAQDLYVNNRRANEELRFIITSP